MGQDFASQFFGVDGNVSGFDDEFMTGMVAEVVAEGAFVKIKDLDDFEDGCKRGCEMLS